MPIVDLNSGRVSNVVVDSALNERDRARAAAGMADLWYFMHEVWGPRHPGYRKLTCDVHRDMVFFIQDAILEWEYLCEMVEKDPAYEGYIVQAMMEAFRGVGKTLIGMAAMGWLQLRNPDAAVAIDSRTQRLSQDFLEPIAHHLDGTDLTSDFVKLYGNWYDANRTWNKTEIVHAKRRNMAQIEASFELSAVDVSQTSHHPNVVWTDDPVNEQDVTEGVLEPVIRHHRSWQNIIRVPGLHLFNGTPYGEGDNISYIKANECKEVPGEPPPWRVLSREAIIINPVTGQEESAAPTVRPLGFLKRIRREDPVNFAAQFMLRPGEGAHTPLTMEQCRALLVNVGDIPTVGYTTMHLDLAWQDPTRTARGDFAVIEEWWHTTFISFCIKLWRKQRCKQEEYLAKFTEWLAELGYGPRMPMLVTMDREKGGLDGALEKIFRGACNKAGVQMPSPVFIDRTSADRKKVRITYAAGQWATGAVRILRGDEVERLFFEMTHIMSSGHDDLADAGADIFHPQVRRMSPFRGEGGGPMLGGLTPEPMPWEELFEGGREQRGQDLRDLVMSRQGELEDFLRGIQEGR